MLLWLQASLPLAAPTSVVPVAAVGPSPTASSYFPLRSAGTILCKGKGQVGPGTIPSLETISLPPTIACKFMKLWPRTYFCCLLRNLWKAKSWVGVRSQNLRYFPEIQARILRCEDHDVRNTDGRVS